MFDDKIVDWSRILRQINGYKALDKFVPGEGGLRYTPVPADVWQAWRDEQNKKELAEWEAKQRAKEQEQEQKDEPAD